MHAIALLIGLLAPTARAADALLALPDADGVRLTWEAHANEVVVRSGDLERLELRPGGAPDTLTARWTTGPDRVYLTTDTPCGAALPELRLGLALLRAAAPSPTVLVTGEPCGPGVIATLLADPMDGPADRWEPGPDRVTLSWSDAHVHRPLRGGAVSWLAFHEGASPWEVAGEIATVDGRHYRLDLPCEDQAERFAHARALFAEAEVTDTTACGPAHTEAPTTPPAAVEVRVISGRDLDLAELVRVRLAAHGEALRRCVSAAVGELEVGMRVDRDGRVVSVTARRAAGAVETSCVAKIAMDLPPFSRKGVVWVRLERAW